MNRIVGCALALLFLSACQPPNAQPDEATVAAAEARIPPPHEALDPLDTDGGKRVVLTVVGFNNTNRDIDEFSVKETLQNHPRGMADVSPARQTPSP